MLIEPHIRVLEINDGDQYLICSDGLTDMLRNIEISDILLRYADCDRCVDALIQAALDRGGKDNVTVILCRISFRND